MAVKTFTTGEVLTASDTNTYLANAGLVYVTSTTVGSAVSSVTVSNVFSSTYDNYRIMYTGGNATNTGGLRFQLGSSTTNYYNTVNYTLWSGGGPTAVTNNNSLGYWQYAGAIDSNSNAFMNIDVFEPFVARSTRFFGAWVQVDSGGNTVGLHRANTSYSGFTITLDAGTISGGTITVYGYRKA